MLSASALKPRMKQAILRELRGTFPVGTADTQSQQQEQMAEAIAEGVCSTLIPYLVTNTIVNPGIIVSTPVGPGATSAPGTIS